MKQEALRDPREIGPADWERLKSILADALAQTSAAERTALIERRCGEDTALLREAESLLAEADALKAAEEDLIEECAEHASARLWNEATLIGNRLGAYIVARELGRGGMGAVYLAARADGEFEKDVAIKVLKRGIDTDEVLRRFRVERQILARLEHPNIARLIDAGTTPEGLPYFVMEYVDGAPVTRFVREQELPLRARLTLFGKICAVVEFAHKHRVIHRDLKPRNILVTAEGEPKLLDFGIAKLLTPGEDGVDLTAASEQRLSPACASPEQAEGRPVTEVSDVYALGALLYELLSGQKSHTFSTPNPSREEVARVVREQEPPLPSSVAEPRVARLLRGDLDAIVLFALRKLPDCRYPTVAALAEDVRRYLAQAPVLARRRTTAYRIKCLAARYRSRRPVLVATAVFLGLSIALWFRAPQEDTRAPAAPSSESSPADATKSIAVLPFDSFTADGASSYFADGVQDNILTDLGKIGGLKVISRSGVAGYRGKARDMKEIGRQLGVTNVLEGSVQIFGDRVRLNAQLIDTRTNTQIWAEHYDRKIEDIFALQSELAQAIAAQLNATLSAREKAAIWKRPTEDMQAYDLYLRARVTMNKADEGEAPREWAKAVALLDDAIKRDPKFALAYALLNEAHLYIYRFGNDHAPARLAAAKNAAETALALEPALEEARLALVRYHYHGLNDYRRTKEELRKLGPSGAHGVEYFTLSGLVGRRLGLWSDTIRDSAKAVELDPQDAMLPFNLVQTLNGLKRYAEAERAANAAIHRLTPQSAARLWLLKNELEVARGNLPAAHAALGAALEKQGMEHQAAQLWLAYFDRDFAAAQELERQAGAAKDTASYLLVFGSLARAVGETERAKAIFEETVLRATAALETRPNESEILVERALASAALGRKEDAMRDARRAGEIRPPETDAVAGPIIAGMVAQTLVWTGDRAGALEMLARLVKVPFGPSYGDLRFNPAWDDLRATPEFIGIVAEAASFVAQDSTASQ